MIETIQHGEAQTTTRSSAANTNGPAALRDSVKFVAALEELGRVLELASQQHILNETVYNNALHSALLLQNCLSGTSLFQSAQQLLFRQQGNKKPWSWVLVYEEPGIRIGLLGVHPASAIPLHDHPNAVGISLILNGNVEISQYDSPTPNTEQAGHIYILKNGHTSEYRRGEVSIYNASQGNIHALSVRNVPAQILSIQYPPRGRCDRHWYFPIFPELANAPEIFAQQVSLEDSAEQMPVYAKSSENASSGRR